MIRVPELPFELDRARLDGRPHDTWPYTIYVYSPMGNIASLVIYIPDRAKSMWVVRHGSDVISHAEWSRSRQ